MIYYFTLLENPWSKSCKLIRQIKFHNFGGHASFSMQIHFFLMLTAQVSFLYKKYDCKLNVATLQFSWVVCQLEEVKFVIQLSTFLSRATPLQSWKQSLALGCLWPEQKCAASGVCWSCNKRTEQSYWLVAIDQHLCWQTHFSLAPAFLFSAARARRALTRRRRPACDHLQRRSPPTEKK